MNAVVLECTQTVCCLSMLYRVMFAPIVLFDVLVCLFLDVKDCPPGVFQAAGEWNPTASIDNLNAYLFSSTLHKGPTLTLTGETTENRTDKGMISYATILSRVQLSEF